jgi:hypothetical protein
MKYAFCFVAVVITVGCGRHEPSQPGAEAQPPGGYSSRNAPQSASTAQSAGQSDGAATADQATSSSDRHPSDQVVSLTGCLEGGEAPPPSGTAPDRAATSAAAATRGAAGAAGPNRFLLRRAKPDPGGAGVGANGAGASGGPLVGAADYVLEGPVAELRLHVNQQVRVSARLAPADTAAAQQLPSTTGSDRTPGSAATRVPSSNGAPPAIPRPDAGGIADSGGASLRRLLVESVQGVGSRCSER